MNNNHNKYNAEHYKKTPMQNENKENSHTTSTPMPNLGTKNHTNDNKYNAQNQKHKNATGENHAQKNTMKKLLMDKTT